MDRITEGLLGEFSSAFDFGYLAEDARFERFCAWLTVRRHFSEATFNPDDLATGKGGDTGIDAIAIIVNNNLVEEVDDVDDLLAINHYLDVTFVFLQAERSAHFESAKLGQFGFGVKDFFGEGKLPSNDRIVNFRKIMSAIFDRSGKFSRNPDCYLYYATSGKWNAEKDLVVRADAEIGDLAKTGMFSDVKFVPIGAGDIRELYRQTKNSIKREFLFDKKVNVPEVRDVTSAWLGFLPAEILLNLVCDENGEIIKSVFYENVRDYLGPAAAVNSEIVATIDDENKSNRFVLMNNGREDRGQTPNSQRPKAHR